MSAMEINKIVAALLVAGVVAMFAGLVSRIVFDAEAEHVGERQLAYAPPNLEPERTEVVAAPPAGPESVDTVFASADIDALVARGEKVAKKCAACHSFEQGGANKVGPALYDVFGGSQAGVDGFDKYSEALLGLGGTWGYEELNEFLFKPKDYAPGTKMGFAGLKKVKDRAAIIAYMRANSGNRLPPP